MPGLDPSIPLQGQTPNPMGTLSGLLQMRNTAQQYQNLQTQNQVGQADLQQKQNMLGEYSNVRQLLADPSKYLDSTGNIDINKAAPDIMRAAPTIGPSMIKNISDMNSASAQAKQALSNLNDDSRTKVGTFLYAQKGKTPQEVIGNLDALGKLNPQLDPAIAYAKKYILAPNANNPDAFDQALTKAAQAAMPVSQQVQATTPSGYLATNNAQTGLMNTAPMAGPTGITPGTLVNNQIPLGERQNLGVNPVTGSYVVTNKDAFGNVTGVTAPPNSTGVYNPQPGDKDALPQLSTEREQARQVALSAPLQHENNRIIMSNIDNVGATGMTGQAWKNISSALGFGGKTPDNEATAYDMVGKGLERNALQAASTMGPQTNAGLEAQVKAMGSLGYTPSAIKQLTRLNDGIVTGSQSYQAGLEKAIAANPSAGVFNKRTFDQEWGANFDPRIYMLYNAQKVGDTATVAQLKKEIGPNGMQELMKKAVNLNKLYSQGHL